MAEVKLKGPGSFWEKYTKRLLKYHITIFPDWKVLRVHSGNLANETWRGKECYQVVLILCDDHYEVRLVQMSFGHPGFF